MASRLYSTTRPLFLSVQQLHTSLRLQQIGSATLAALMNSTIKRWRR